MKKASVTNPTPPVRLLRVAAVLPALLGLGTTLGVETDMAELREILAGNCYECHGSAEAEQDVDYENMSDEELLADAELLDLSLFMIEENEMPPSRAEPLSDPDRKAILMGLEMALANLENANPGDPGVVVAPRVNHSEYDSVVRELTGLDLELGKLLVPDNQAGEGFLNVGAAQNMTVGQFEAYLSTAKTLVRHARVSPSTGIEWREAPLPPDATQPDGIRGELVEEWRQWHDDEWDAMFENHTRSVKQATGMFLGAYFEAAWRYHHRAALGTPDASFEDIAANYDVRLYTTGVREIYELLTDEPEDEGLMVEWLSERWHALPGPEADDDAVRRDCRDLVKFIDKHGGGRADDWAGRIERYELKPDNKTRSQEARGKIHHGAWPYWIDLDKTEGRTLYLVVADGGDGNEGDFAFWENGLVRFADGSEKPLHELTLPLTAVTGETPAWRDGKLRVHAPSVLQLEMPDDAKMLEIELRLDREHRETASIQTVILDRPPRTTGHLIGRGIPGASRGGFDRARKLARSIEFLDRLDETDHKHPRDDRAFTDWPDNYSRFYEIEDQADTPRGAFGPLPPEIYLHMDDAQLAELERLRNRVVDAAQPPLHDLATLFRENGLGDFPEGAIPDQKQLARLDAETREHAERLVAEARDLLAEQEAAARELLRPFVERSWRRPVSDRDLDPLVGFYRDERSSGASFDASVKVAMSAALIHPHFLYRFNARNQDDKPRPLTGRELATRLAFTLWGSLPDDELLALGDDLRDDEILRAQLRRMREDERAVAMAREFAAHWLQFHDFEQSVTPDPDRFAGFEKVKDDMTVEVELFFADLFRENRPVTNIIDADYAFLNKDLASWYGVGGVQHNDFRRVVLKGEDRARRGGIFGMGAVLVKYSEPLRTSPVRRGAWFHEHLLGNHLPSPPADVPPISDDERNEEGQSIREQLEEHRDNPTCFSCHDKIDPPGVALEKFDAVGRWRETDLAEMPIDDQGKFVETGRVLDGVEGLRHYVLELKEDFLATFCRELLGYCLGREVEPTDQLLIGRMLDALEADDLRPAAALEAVILSQQFRQRRNSNL